MRRIYFLAPNVEISRKIVDALLLACIEARHIRKHHPDAECGITDPHTPFSMTLQRDRPACRVLTNH